MTTLTEFLLARIAEDEDAAKAAVDPAHQSDAAGHWEMTDYGPYDGGTMPREPDNHPGLLVSDEPWAIHATRHDPARVLAECAAKRRIMEVHKSIGGKIIKSCDVCADDGPHYDRSCLAWPCPTIRALAAIYADHPAFDPEWAL